MKARRKLYTDEERDGAVCRVVKGERIAAVSRETGIPAITLGRYMKRHRAGQPAHEQRRGTKPTLPLQAENNIVSGIAGMQRSGAPVGREAIVQKANDIRHRLRGSTCGVRDLTHGAPRFASSPLFTHDLGPRHPTLPHSTPDQRSSRSVLRLHQVPGRYRYRRFRSRHPRLTVRVAQKVSCTRNSVDVGDLRTLFHTLATLTIEHRLQPSQVFNMDETSFTSQANTKKVVAVKGSPNVHTNSSEISFHLSFAAAVAACGFAVPSLFIVPGVRISRSILDECIIEGAAVTTAPKGFINGDIFLKWIDHFAANVPVSMPRPLVLICDGCSSRISHVTLERCDSLRILLACLPPNATHLVQPLDVSVFRPFKRGITTEITKSTTYTSATTISKTVAIQIASKALVEHVQNKKQNIVNGFKSTGLYPPSIDMMGKRLEKFNSPGTKRGESLGSETWLQVREKVRTEILILPPKREKLSRQRKTVDVGGRLLTKELLASGGNTHSTKRSSPNNGSVAAVV